MTKTKTFIAISMLLAFVSVFGAWTGSYDGETRYADATLISPYATEKVYYTNREKDLKQTEGGCPFYSPISGLTNSCGAVAGSEIVAFYDKYYPELIPGWVSYFEKTGKYRLQETEYVTPLMNDLYTRMRTNVDDVGVSRTDFLNGLKSYVNERGYQISYQNAKSGSKLNYETCKNAIDNNKVIVIFASPTNVYNVSISSDHDVIAPLAISSAHIMVAYGYIQIKYSNEKGVFRTDTYLIVAMGQPLCKLAYYKVDSSDTEAAYIVNIQ